ncbi:MAG: hypothetical protein GXX96_29610 [Planctomycetaceae bacterium]|nr:hypothetical protein [Planctomycetaceae bacterium]
MSSEFSEAIEEIVTEAVGHCTDSLYSSYDGEPAPGELVNVVGGLLAIARGLERIADAMHIDNVSHSICMGIRKGLFGADAESYRSILELKRDDD